MAGEDVTLVDLNLGLKGEFGFENSPGRLGCSPPRRRSGSLAPRW